MKKNNIAGNWQQSMLCVALLGLFTITGCSKKLATDTNNSLVSKQGAATTAALADEVHTHSVIFTGGTGGYHSYRIPSLVNTNNGTLIAICEAREVDNFDFGNINIVCRRSTNNGDSWLPMQVIIGNGHGVWGNPTSVYDATTGRVWLFMSWNSEEETSLETITAGDRRVYSCYSDDDGATWSSPVNRTDSLQAPGTTWDAMGPGIGIQTKYDHPGRLIIPALKRNIYSDDHGLSWKRASIPASTNEGAIVELLDGRLMRNDRAKGPEPWTSEPYRRVSIGSIEGGFPAFAPDLTLLDPKCEGSIVRYNTSAPGRIIFLNSASSVEDNRYKMRVRISEDEGNIWTYSRRIYDYLTLAQAAAQGKGGYSSMIRTSDFAIGALVENSSVPGGNRNTNHFSIDFHKFNLPWIMAGTP